MTYTRGRVVVLAALIAAFSARVHVETPTAPLNGPVSVPTVTAPTPPPPNVDSRFLGGLSFKDGYPTAETVQRLYDQLDFQRGTQVVLRNLPALSMYGLRLGLARDLGVDSVSKFAIFRADANSLMLTPNFVSWRGSPSIESSTNRAGLGN